jgi:hypothetical protein
VLTFPEFKAEMDASQARVVERCLSDLASLGMSQQGLDFVRDLQGYPRTPYYTTLWVRDPRARADLGAGVSIHAVGVKLIDDLIDDDQPLSPRDQIFGVQLLAAGTTLLAGRDRPVEVLKTLEDDYRDIWRQEIVEVSAPRPTSVESWIAAARIKAGVMLANYAAVNCLAGGAPEMLAPARQFGEALGVLYMIGDDAVDFDEIDERDGNLAHLVRSGAVGAGEVAAVIDEWRDRAVAACRQGEPICDMVPFFDHFAVKLKGLIARPAAAAR